MALSGRRFPLSSRPASGHLRIETRRSGTAMGRSRMTRDQRHEAIGMTVEAYAADFRALSTPWPWGGPPRAFLDLLERLDPLDLAALDAACRSRLAWPGVGPRLRRRRARLLSQLARRPEAAPLLALDPDGHLRAAAVKAWEKAPPFAMALALLVRSNDWVPAVRALALERLPRALVRLEAWRLDRLVPLLLDRMPDWRREDPDRPVAELLLAHPRLREAMLRRLREERSGPLARRLRFLLREADCDGRLPELAIHARSAAVRAVAMETLLSGAAQWTDGWTWRWIDKPLGLRRRERRRRSRPLLAQVAPDGLLAAAAADRSSVVRRVAADALIRLGPVLPEPTLAALRRDRSRSVSARLAFCDRKWREDAANFVTVK